MGKKQELIQLHQLYAQVQQFLTHECDLPADSQSLSAYSTVTTNTNNTTNNDNSGENQEDLTYVELGVDALDINAPTEKKMNAITTLLDELTNLLACQPNTERDQPVVRGVPVNSTEQVQTQIQNLETGETAALTLDVFATGMPEDEVERTEFEVVPGYEEETTITQDESKNGTLAQWGAVKERGEEQTNKNVKRSKTKTEPATTNGEQTKLNNIPAQ